MKKVIYMGLINLISLSFSVGCTTNNYTINRNSEAVVVNPVPKNVVIRLQGFTAREISRVKLVLAETCTSLGTSQRKSHEITDINCQPPPQGGVIEAIENALIKYDVPGKKLNAVDGIITVY